MPTTCANANPIAAGSGGSVLVDRCQVSGSTDLRSILFVGFLPPVNTMAPIGTRPNEQPAYPAELLYCPESKLVQLGLIVDPAVLFPPHYAYTSGTTRILRENFAELYDEVMRLYPISGRRPWWSTSGRTTARCCRTSTSGGHRVCGIEPTDTRKIAHRARHPDDQRVLRAGGRRAGGARSTGARRSSPRPTCSRTSRTSTRSSKSILAMLDDDGHFHLGVALSAAAHRDAAVRHDLPRAPALLLAAEPEASARDARAGGHPREADSDPRRIDPRVRGAARDSGRCRRRSQSCWRVEDREAHVGSLAGVSPPRVAEQARPHGAVEGDSRPRAPGLRGRRAVAREHAGQLRRPRRRDHRLRPGDQGFATRSAR